MSSLTASIDRGWRAPTLDDRIIAVSRSRTAWWTALAAACAVLLVPLFLVDVPPLLDYPNHLARMYVLAFGAHDPILSQMYTQHWAIIPNLAIDVVLPKLLKVLPIYVAGRVVLGVTLVLPVLGAAAYHRAVFGERSWWPLCMALISYNALFILGFMNFQLALGMALLVAAGWARWADRHPLAVTLAGVAASTAIFFMHLFGLLFLGTLLAATELAALWRQRADHRGILRRLRRDLLVGAVIFVPPVVLYLLAPISAAGGRVVWLPLLEKPLWLFEPFMTYDGGYDLFAGMAFLFLLDVLLRFRRLLVAPGVGAAMLVLLAAYLAAPFVMQGTGFIDARFPLMIGMLCFAGLRPVHLSPRVAAAIAAALGVVFIARTTSLATVWYDHNRDVADMRHVISFVPPASKVLVVSVDPEDVPAYWAALPRGRQIPDYFRIDFHLPALLLIERKAFFPCLFAVPMKQPLALRPPYDRVGAPECQPPDWQSLVVGYSVHPVTPSPYLANWQRNFDYVLLLNAGGAGDLTRYLPDKLQLIGARDVVALYRIRRTVPGS